jgi:hypothetical protein
MSSVITWGETWPFLREQCSSLLMNVLSGLCHTNGSIFREELNQQCQVQECLGLYFLTHQSGIALK